VIGDVRYVAPESVSQATAVLAADPGAVVLGGGTWVLPQLVRRERRATVIIDTARLGLTGIRRDGDGLRIGAAVTYSSLAGSELVSAEAPLLTRMAAGITGGVQLRNQATIGGAACYAIPSSDVPACLVALGAELELHSSAGGNGADVRRVTADAFFLDAGRTQLRPGELLVDIVLPSQPRPWGYQKLKLSEGSWPIATAAATPAGGSDVAITLGGVATRPLRITVHNEEEIAAAVREQLSDPWHDVLASAAYRRRVAPVIARRALAEMQQVAT
jgi:carbon-monoxide dehydrogenase medium subunit